MKTYLFQLVLCQQNLKMLGNEIGLHQFSNGVYIDVIQVVTTVTCSATEQHQKHPSHGYHMLAKAVFEATGWVFSHNLAHKCCKQAGIRSKARKHLLFRSYIIDRVSQHWLNKYLIVIRNNGSCSKIAFTKN